MPAKLVTVLKCSRAWEAEIVRERLEAAGIRAFVQDGESATSLSYVGVALGGVKVQVAEPDAERAIQLMAEDERQHLTAGPWECPRCAEPNDAAFDFCYSCSMPRGDTPSSFHQDADGVVAADDIADQHDQFEVANPSKAPDITNSNPYSYSGPIDKDGLRDLPVRRSRLGEEEAEEIVTRATRWAVVGLFFPIPIFHIVSLGLITMAGSEGAFQFARLRRRAIVLIVFDVLLLVVMLLFVVNLWLG